MPRRDDPIITPRSQRIADFKRRRLPLIVWSVAAAACVALLTGRANRFEYIGMAQTREYEISSATTGTLQTVLVDLFDEVRAGEAVAKLDDVLVRAAVETTAASIRQLRAELDAARVSARSDSASWTADLRRFQIDEEERRLAALALRVEIETDEIDLERLALEVERSTQLLDVGLVDRNQHDRLKLEHERVGRHVAENRILLAQTEQEFEVARERRARFEAEQPAGQTDTSVLQPLIEAITVETQRLREVELQREGLVLRSPVDGQISQLFCRSGQAVVRGEPIVAVAEQNPREILAYLAEDEAPGPRENAAVLVASRRDPNRVAESVVLRVSPAIQALPQRLWRDPTVPDYGRAVVIAARPGLELVPGEVVTVRFPQGD